MVNYLFMGCSPVNRAVDKLLSDLDVVVLALVQAGHRANRLAEETVGNAQHVGLVNDSNVLQNITLTAEVSDIGKEKSNLPLSCLGKLERHLADTS